VPDQIVVAVVAELTLYEFGGRGGRFAKLLRILEKLSVPGQIDGAFVATTRRVAPNWRRICGNNETCRAKLAVHLWQQRDVPRQIGGAFVATTKRAAPNWRRMDG